MTQVEQMVDELTYRCYKANRTYAPDIAPERWEKIFGPQAKELENKFQLEKQKGEK